MSGCLSRGGDCKRACRSGGNKLSACQLFPVHVPIPRYELVARGSSILMKSGKAGISLSVDCPRLQLLRSGRGRLGGSGSVLVTAIGHNPLCLMMGILSDWPTGSETHRSGRAAWIRKQGLSGWIRIRIALRGSEPDRVQRVLQELKSSLSTMEEVQCAIP